MDWRVCVNWQGQAVVGERDTWANTRTGKTGQIGRIAKVFLEDGSFLVGRSDALVEHLNGRDCPIFELARSILLQFKVL